MARGLLTLMPTTPMVMPEFLSDLPLDWTPSPRDLMPPPRALLPMPITVLATALVSLDITMARGLLTLMPSMPMAILMLLLEFPSDPPLVLTPSPRDLMPPLRDMPHTPIMDMALPDITMVRFSGRVEVIVAILSIGIILLRTDTELFSAI